MSALRLQRSPTRLSNPPPSKPSPPSSSHKRASNPGDPRDAATFPPSQITSPPNPISSQVQRFGRQPRRGFSHGRPTGPRIAAGCRAGHHRRSHDREVGRGPPPDIRQAATVHDVQWHRPHHVPMLAVVGRGRRMPDLCRLRPDGVQELRRHRDWPTNPGSSPDAVEPALIRYVSSFSDEDIRMYIFHCFNLMW